MVRRGKKPRRFNQFFLFLLPLVILFAAGILFFSIQSDNQRLADSSCGCGPPLADATGEFETDTDQPIFDDQPIEVAMVELMPDLALIQNQERMVLGVQDDGRWIEIDLSDQRLYAREGDRIVYNFLISTGKRATPTPKGDFRIWLKLKYTKMSGGTPGVNYYYLPNVPYTQYFYRGYGLHGTYWHNNFGNVMSHGCVNLATPDAEKLFYWTSPPVPADKRIAYPSKDNPGTRVIVRE